jgi:hypothetical protein
MHKILTNPTKINSLLQPAKSNSVQVPPNKFNKIAGVSTASNVSKNISASQSLLPSAKKVVTSGNL